MGNADNHYQSINRSTCFIVDKTTKTNVYNIVISNALTNHDKFNWIE